MLESSLDCKEVQPWVFIGRTDAEAETPKLWPPDVKSWLIRKDPDAGKDWGQEEKGTTEDEMVGCHHQFNGHGFGWTQGVGDGQRGLACCGSWGCKESYMTDWSELNWMDWKVSNIHVGLRILSSQSEGTSLNMWGIQLRQKMHVLELKLKTKERKRERERWN